MKRAPRHEVTQDRWIDVWMSSIEVVGSGTGNGVSVIERAGSSLSVEPRRAQVERV